MHNGEDRFDGSVLGGDDEGEALRVRELQKIPPELLTK